MILNLQNIIYQKLIKHGVKWILVISWKRLWLFIVVNNNKKLSFSFVSRCSHVWCRSRRFDLIVWRRLAVCSRNVAIYITRDYIVRQTKNLAFYWILVILLIHTVSQGLRVPKGSSSWKQLLHGLNIVECHKKVSFWMSVSCVPSS